MHFMHFALLCFLLKIGICDICDLADDLNTCYKKFLSFEGIGNIHKQIDGDQNGQVDSSETAKFVKKEFSPVASEQKPRSLTWEDPYVSLSDLWAMWRRNPAFGWSVKQTVQWLCDVVELPQYSEIFVRHSVDGKSLPLLAMNNMSYLNDVLMIRNPIDKRKLMLKSLDAILFGSPTKPQLMPSPQTTAVLGVLVLVVIGLSHWFYQTRIMDKKCSDNSASPACNERTLNELQARLDDLEQIQYRLNDRELGAQISSILYSQLPVSPSWSDASRCRGRLPSSKSRAMLLPLDSGSQPKMYLEGAQARQDLDSRDSPIEEENQSSGSPFVRSETTLSMLDQDLTSVRRKSTPDIDGPVSVELQLWLQLTYALEAEHYRKRKGQAEAQLNAARQACDRLHRKRFHILGPVRLLYSESFEELELKLLQAKSDLEHLEKELQERTNRWNHIEALTGVQISTHLGIPQIRKLLASIQQAEPLLPETISPTSLSPVRFEVDSPGSIDSTDAEQPQETPQKRMSIPDVVNLLMANRNAGKMGSTTKPTPTSKVVKNESFVRPFATMWHRKAVSRLGPSKPK